MDLELKQYLDGRFAQIDARFAQIDARFAQIDARFAQIDARFEAADQELRSVRTDANERESRLRDHMETVETRLLSEFWKWARTAEMRWRRLDTDSTIDKERLTAIEDRVAELERRNYPRSGAA